MGSIFSAKRSFSVSKKSFRPVGVYAFKRFAKRIRMAAISAREALPPGERVLVLEKDRKTYCPCEEIVCYGWVKNAYPEHIPGVTVADNSLGVFCVINQSNALLERVTVTYKNYDTQSGMFIGGTSYRVEVERLQPGETRAISPYHYAQGSSRIVAVTAQYMS